MSYHEARKQALNDSLRTLSAWAAKRAGMNVNTETTLTVLARKVEEIADRVYRAGQRAPARKTLGNKSHVMDKTQLENRVMELYSSLETATAENAKLRIYAQSYLDSLVNDGVCYEAQAEIRKVLGLPEET